MSGRGLEPRGQSSRCHQFQFCPSWPEGAGDFPEWGRTIRGQAAWRQGRALRTPSLAQLGALQGRHRNPWRVGLSPCTPVVGPSSTTARQLQPKSMATEEFLGLFVPANEGFKGTAAPGAPEKYFQDESGGVPSGYLIRCQSTRQKPQEPPKMAPSSSSLSSTSKEGKWGVGGQAGKAPCLCPGPPLWTQPGGRSAPEPAEKWAPGRGEHLTGPCSWEISCETCFKPPNHKNGRFSQPCSHVSQISRGLFSISIQETPGQPPAPRGGHENGARRLGCRGNPSRVHPKHAVLTNASVNVGSGRRARRGPDKENWKSG